MEELYESKIFGLGEGNQITLAKLIQKDIIPENSLAIEDLNTYIRTCEMKPEELIGVIKNGVTLILIELV